MLLSALLVLPLISSALAATSPGRVEQPVAELSLPKRQDVPLEAAAGGAFDGHDGETTTDGGAGDGTTFNGKPVPKGIELNAKTMDEDLASGYWMVEFFSPYCGHCKRFAPTWQTLYEYYYTLDPLPQTDGTGASDSDLNSFTRFYNFKFAKVDCVVNADACSQKQIHSFPSIVLFKDGEVVDTRVGEKSLSAVSQWVEETLESIRPGSRPQDGPKLPKVGDRSAPDMPVIDKVADKITTSTKSRSTVSATPLAKPTPNDFGKSVELTAEEFQRRVTTTHDPWFIKFYVPWCQHCQAMAPNWQGMARQMRDQLNIGEVNCEIEKRLCKDVRVKGYPTLLFFRGGERIEYDGLRGLGDLISFANKAVSLADGVKDVDAAAFEAMEQEEEVIFLYFYDHATTTEDFAALERLVLSLIGRAKLVKTNDRLLADRFKISTWPRLLVSRDGKPTYYTALSPRDMRDFRRVLGWMESVWQPIVPELTASNAREIMNGKLVVLGILSRDRSDEFIIAKREIKNAALEWIDKQTQAFQLERQELRDAKQLRIEEAEDRNDQRALRNAKSIRIDMNDIERKEVGFAWVDGVFWERWIRTTFGISVKDGERVVVNDIDNRRYWDVTMTGNPIVPSRTSILETLPRIISNPPRLAPKSTTTALGHLWWTLRGGVTSHPLLSAALGLLLLLAGGVYGRRFIRRNGGGGIFLGSEKGGPMDGLLGNGAGQGKVD